MKEEKGTAALQWFADFSNIDLEQIGPGDRAKLLIEADCLWPREELTSYAGFVPLPKEALHAFAWALKMPGKESPKYWSAIVASQRGIRNLFALLHATQHPSPEGHGGPSTGAASIMRGHDEVLWWLGKGPGLPYTLTFLPVTKSQEDYLRLKILRLLEGFNQHAIRLCPGCNRWFFNPTNHEKRFCGNRCIWRTNSAKRRKAASKSRKEAK
jgi:hypothetical protein